MKEKRDNVKQKDSERKQRQNKYISEMKRGKCRSRKLQKNNDYTLRIRVYLMM